MINSSLREKGMNMNGQAMDEDGRMLWLRFSLEDWKIVSEALLSEAGNERGKIGLSRDMEEAQERGKVVQNCQRLGMYIRHVVMEREAEVRVNE